LTEKWTQARVLWRPRVSESFKHSEAASERFTEQRAAFRSKKHLDQ
jgi:hypothetical protein